MSSNGIEFIECRLDDIAEIHNYKRRPLNSRERENMQGQYPYYGASGIFDYLNDYIFDGEYVLISEDGENLKSRKTPIAFKVDGKFWVNNHAHIVKGKEELINEFIVYYFANLDLNPFVTGAVQPKLNKENLLSIPIFMPKKPEIRNQFVSVLKSIDDKIQNNLATNQTLEEIARTLFKEWFVNFNYPNADGKMKDSEIGEIPVGWEVVELGELIESISETYKFGDKKEIIFLNTGDILDGHFLHNEYSEISKLPGQAKKSISINDILFSEIRPANKRFAFVSFNAEDYVVSTKLMVLRSKAINPLFFYFYLTREETLKHLQNVAESRSGTFPQITFSQLKEIKIPMPNHNILDKFIQIIESNYSRIQDNIEENKILKELRDSLLPKLMSGEIEVNG